MEKKQKILKVLDAIAADMKRDAASMDGKPFTGKTVATYYGYHGAAIASLANIIKEVINDDADRD